MNDIINKIGYSTIHHGKNSNRIYLMFYDKRDDYNIIASLENLAISNNYTKIIAKIPLDSFKLFYENGYSPEATIPKYYNSNQDCIFMCKYLSNQRKFDNLINKYFSMINLVTNKDKNDNFKFPNEYSCCILKKDDINYITTLFKKVFTTYPFPIFDNVYIEETMMDNVKYFGIWYKGDLIGVSSAEINFHSNNVEMTDFAVLGEHSRKNLSSLLLQTMEQEMKKQGISTAYTIARAKSFGMNTTFAKNGYTYTGTLINNTYIQNSIESMNVWYKLL